MRRLNFWAEDPQKTEFLSTRLHYIVQRCFQLSIMLKMRREGGLCDAVSKHQMVVYAERLPDDQ